MITFLLKFILCTAVLYAAYYFLLRQEKTLQFNRFFLLSIIGLSLLFPKLITKTEYIQVSKAQLEYFDNTPSILEVQTINALRAPQPTLTIKTTDVLWVFYALITGIFLFRFVRNLYQIRQLQKGAKLIKTGGLKICLRDDIHASFTFLNTIYLNRKTFEAQEIPQEIIDHEAVHAKQKHSLDIILIEAFQCFLWFNPIVYLVKSAIKMNHEYLADARVCEHMPEISQYQKTLIQYVYHSKQQPVLASQLTFGQTKNRLNMMVKNLAIRSAALRICTTMVIVSIALWAFGETQVIAQEQGQITKPTVREIKEQQDKQQLPMIIEVPGPNQQVKFKDSKGQWIEKAYGELTKAQKEYFREPGAQSQVFIAPMPAKSVSRDLFESLADETKYGIWVDGQRIKNEAINRFKPTDFHHYQISKLNPGARNYGKHEFQIDLTTNKHYENSESAKGSWIPYPPVKVKKMSEENKGPKQQQQKLPPPPPPPAPRQIKLNERSKVKFKDASGSIIESEFGELSENQKEAFRSSEGHAMIFLPPPPPAFINKELLEKHATGEFKIWIDDKEVSPKELLKRDPKEFYLYNRGQKTMEANGDVEWKGINFVTKSAFEASDIAKGSWIAYNKVFEAEQEDER